MLTNSRPRSRATLEKTVPLPLLLPQNTHTLLNRLDALGLVAKKVGLDFSWVEPSTFRWSSCICCCNFPMLLLLADSLEEQPPAAVMISRASKCTNALQSPLPARSSTQRTPNLANYIFEETILIYKEITYTYSVHPNSCTLRLKDLCIQELGNQKRKNSFLN